SCPFPLPGNCSRERGELQCNQKSMEIPSRPVIIGSPGQPGDDDREMMPNTLLTLFDTDRYREYYRAGFWRDDTVYALVRAHAARTPERVAVRSAQGDLTYRALLAL